jgi:hypothetical protein
MELQIAKAYAKIDDTKLLRDKLDKLILSTPSGELRNELTDISILFENIINN